MDTGIQVQYDHSDHLEHADLWRDPRKWSNRKTTVLASTIRDFIRLESAGGILLLVTAVLAMVAANSPLSVFMDNS